MDYVEIYIWSSFTGKWNYQEVTRGSENFNGEIETEKYSHHSARETLGRKGRKIAKGTKGITRSWAVSPK